MLYGSDKNLWFLLGREGVEPSTHGSSGPGQPDKNCYNSAGRRSKFMSVLLRLQEMTLEGFHSAPGEPQGGYSSTMLFPDDRQIHRFRSTYSGAIFVFVSRRHGWEAFVKNNLSYCLPKDATMLWIEGSIHGDPLVRYAIQKLRLIQRFSHATVATKPPLMHRVATDRIQSVYLHDVLIQY